jgi:protein disulfide-isomerase-like protein
MSRGGHWRQPAIGLCLWLVIGVVLSGQTTRALFLPDLSPTGFRNYIENRGNDTIAAVKVYAPWCHHCQDMEDDWNILGNIFADLSNVVIASINGDKHVKLRESLGVTGYPTIFLYDKGAEKPRDWKYARNWGVLAMEMKRMAQEAGGSTASEVESVAIPQSPTLLTEYRARYARVTKQSPIIKLDENSLTAVAFDRSRDVVLAVTKQGAPQMSSFMKAFAEAGTSFVVAGHSPNEIVFAEVDAATYNQIQEKEKLPTLKSAPAVLFLPQGPDKRTKIDTLVSDAGAASKMTAAALIDLVNAKAGTEITVGGALHPQAGRIPQLDSIIAACFNDAAFRAKYPSYDEARRANFSGVSDLIKQTDQKLEDKVYELSGDGTLSAVQGNFYLKTFEKFVDPTSEGLKEIVQMIGRYEHTLEEAPLKKSMQASHLREFARMRNLMRIFEEHSEELRQEVEKLTRRVKSLVADSVTIDILDDKFRGDDETRERFAARVRTLSEARAEALAAASRGQPYRAREAVVAQAVAGIRDKHVWVVPKGSIIPNEVVFKVAEQKLPDLVVVLGPAAQEQAPQKPAFYSKHDKMSSGPNAAPAEPLEYTENATDLATVTRYLERAMLPPPPSSVVELTDKTFAKVALDKGKIVMVAFVASWCGHCKRLKPEYEKAAAIIGRRGLDPDRVVMAMIDADKYDRIRDEYAIQGFPTIKLFHASDNLVEDYQGGRSAAELLSYLESKAQEDASGKRLQTVDDESKGGRKFVQELTPETLDALLEQPDKAVLLMLYAPWCGACQRLKASYEKLAEYFASRREDVVIARLDADKHASEVEQRIKIEHYPTFRFWRKGGPEKRAMDESLDELRYDVDLVALRHFVEEHAGTPKPVPLGRRIFRRLLTSASDLLGYLSHRMPFQVTTPWYLAMLSLSTVFLVYGLIRVLPTRARKRALHTSTKKTE